ncbi:glutathione S-transferase T3-like [Hordeum vulgare]|nr:glutathione S-transferase T3-like [Hordeum vulgare]
MEPPAASFVAPAAPPASSLPPSARRPATAAPPAGLVRRPGRPGRRREEAACWRARRPPPARPGRRLCRPGHSGAEGEEEALTWAEGGSGAEGEEDDLQEEVDARPGRPVSRTSVRRARGARRNAYPVNVVHGLLEEAEVDIGAPPLEPFGFGDGLQEEDDEEEKGEDEEEVTEIEEEAFAAVGKPTLRSTNYSEAEDILLIYDKWKLRDQETSPKKSAMLRMDDSEEEGRNEHKPTGNKKDKLRKKMEGEASSIREKIEHMMKSKEALTMKTLETKLLINEKKKEVKLAQVEARREDAKRKADLEERMIKVKEAKAWKKTHGGREGAHDDVQEGHG